MAVHTGLVAVAADLLELDEAGLAEAVDDQGMPPEQVIRYVESAYAVNWISSAL